MKSIRNLLVVLATLAFVFTSQSCGDKGDDGPAGPTQNIHEYLSSSGGFSIMLAALDKYGWTAKLNGGGNFTILAVSDLQLQADGVDLSGADAEDIVNMHVFDGALKPADFPNNKYLTCNAAAGPNNEKLGVFIQVVGENVRFDGVNYVEKVEATNGMIYKMEGTLKPKTVLQALAINPNIDKYKVALNLESTIKSKVTSGTTTVFATSETKFIQFLNDNNTTVTAMVPATRRAILNNSIIEGSNMSESQLTGTLTTLGAEMTITSSGGSLTINGKASVEASNGQCTDGVIHVISDLLN